MLEKKQKLILRITGQKIGKVSEFIDFLRTLNREYLFVLAFLQTCEYLSANYSYGDVLPEIWTILNRFLEEDREDKELIIVKASYNSPFELHFEGISCAIEKLSDLHERRRDDKAFGRDERKRKAKLENDLMEVDIQNKRLENEGKILEYTAKYAEFLGELGYSAEQIKTTIQSKMGIQDIIETSAFQEKGYVDNIAAIKDENLNK